MVVVVGLVALTLRRQPPATHLLTPKPRVYAVRTADGRYALLRLLSYYCPGPTPGCITFEYVYRGDGGRGVR